MGGVSIHAPRAGRDLVRANLPEMCDTVSIHAPRAGRDSIGITTSDAEAVFQSTRPVRGATKVFFMPVTVCRFQSTRPVRGATLSIVRLWRCWSFNPRAPCGARRVRLGGVRRQLAVSIHAPRAGRDGDTNNVPVSLPGFQSTRPVRGATSISATVPSTIRVSIHAPRAGRDRAHSRRRHRSSVSIHAPRAGRDGRATCRM